MPSSPLVLVPVAQAYSNNVLFSVESPLETEYVLVSSLTLVNGSCWYPTNGTSFASNASKYSDNCSIAFDKSKFPYKVTRALLG